MMNQGLDNSYKVIIMKMGLHPFVNEMLRITLHYPGK